MNKTTKIFIIILLSLSLFGCAKEDKQKEIIDTSSNEVETFDYSSMDTVKAYTMIEGIKHEYTFYFKDNSCINAMVKIVFDTEGIAKSFYNSMKDNEMYSDVKLEGNLLTYYFNRENFEYGMYSEKTLKEYIQRDGEFVIE